MFYEVLEKVQFNKRNLDMKNMDESNETKDVKGKKNIFFFQIGYVRTVNGYVRTSVPRIGYGGIR